MACRPSKVARRKTTNVALKRQQPTVLLMHASSIVEGRDVVAYAHAYTTPSTHEASAGPVQYTNSTQYACNVHVRHSKYSCTMHAVHKGRVGGPRKKDGCARTTESLALFSRGRQEAVT